MHLFASLERTTSTQTIAFLGTRSFLSFLYPPSGIENPQRALRRSRRGPLCDSTIHSMDDCFIKALVSASTCHRHRFNARNAFTHTRGISSHHKARRKPCTRLLHTSSHDGQESMALKAHGTREDYKGLVDQYPGPPQPTDRSFLIHHELASRPFLDIVDEQDANEIPETQNEAEKLAGTPDLSLAVETVIRLANDVRSSHEDIHQAYKKLPSPGVALLPQKAIRNLLHRMSVTTSKNETFMLRYLFLVDEMKEAGLPLSANEWNSAVHLAGRSFRRVCATEVESAIRLWKRMEHDAGVRGNRATFNILFDIAVKAGKFVLADMILGEMKERKLGLDRFTRVGLIYLEGAKGNGKGVRAAYQSLVEEGEIVDTVVLNCVIVSLLKAGEGSAAELVFERMKRLNARFLKRSNPDRPLELPPPQIRAKDRRDLRGALRDAAGKLSQHPKLLELLQDSQCLTPDLDTFAHLISHHALNTGELDRVIVLLHEMKYYGIPLNGKIFVLVIRGFRVHGGIRYSLWTEKRLDSVWDAFWHAAHSSSGKDVVEQQSPTQARDDVHLGKWMIIWCLRAYSRCAGTGRMLEVWDQIRSKWDPAPDEIQSMQKLLGALIRESPRSAQEWDH